MAHYIPTMVDVPKYLPCQLSHSRNGPLYFCSTTTVRQHQSALVQDSTLILLPASGDSLGLHRQGDASSPHLRHQEVRLSENSIVHVVMSTQ